MTPRTPAIQEIIMSTPRITSKRRAHCNSAFLDRSCSTLMQMRTVKLLPTDFGFFSCDHQNDQTEKYLLLTNSQLTSGWKAGRFARVGTRLSAREQLRACVKWDLVDCYIFIFSNFVRQYFRFRSVNFFQVFGDN